MKTLPQIQLERSQIFESVLNDEMIMTKPELAKAQKRVQFLNLCVNYLKTDPKEDFILKEINRIETRLQLINDQYKEWLPIEQYEDSKQRFAAYLSLNKTKDLKEQLKTLHYLLNQ